MADKLVVCKDNVIKIKIGSSYQLLEGQTECEYTNEITSQDTAFKNTIWDVNTPTRHKATASVTCRRMADGPVQLYLLDKAETEVGDDCRVEAEILSGDGFIRSGIFNVAISNVGVSGAAGDLADFVADLTCATADGITVTYDSTNAAYTAARAALDALEGNSTPPAQTPAQQGES